MLGYYGGCPDPQIIPKQSAWLLHPMPNAEKEKGEAEK